MKKLFLPFLLFVLLPFQQQSFAQSAANTYETSILQLIFNNTTFAGLGDTSGIAGTDTVGKLYASLYTASPGETGNQTTNEANYTGYHRIGAARSSAGWTVAADSVVNAAAMTFPQCTGSSDTATYYGIGTDSTGNGKLLFYGSLATNLSIITGVTPNFAIGKMKVKVE